MLNFFPGTPLSVYIRRLPCIHHPTVRARLFAKTTPRPPPDNKLQLKNLLSSLRTFLGKVQDREHVDGFVHKKLDYHLPRTSEPHVTYERVISFLINNGFFLEAGGVFVRMTKEGFVPSSDAYAQILAVMLAISDSDAEINNIFDAIISDPAFSEERFVQLLQVMSDMETTHDHLVRIVERYVDTREEGYVPTKALVSRLVDAQTRAGFLEEAIETLLRVDDREASSLLDPSIAIIDALKDTNPSDKGSVNRILDLIKEKDIQPTIALFNTLISRELRLKSLSGAFSMYNFARQLSEVTPIYPDGSTFAILFSVLTKLYRPHGRSALSRRYKIPDNSIPPRQLFHGFLSVYAHSPFKVTPRLLNVILRTFIFGHDYAGAFVALRAFRIFKLNVTAKTYYIVLRHTMHRILWDVKRSRNAGESRWGDRFLGITSRTRFMNLKIDEKMEQKILLVTSQRVFDLSSRILKSPAEARRTGGSKYTTPTVAMIDGEAPVPAPMHLDIVPLERILRRAVSADIHDELEKDPDIAASRVSKAVAKAKKEMIPRSVGSSDPIGNEDISGKQDSP
jgi:pentatricopeptide repeat protein